MRKRHGWDRIKCVIATGVPTFWIIMLAVRGRLPPAASGSFPAWLAVQFQPLLEDTPAFWTIVISLAVAGFQWYNLVYYQRRVIPVVREMYERALARRDPDILTVLADALHIGTWRQSIRHTFRRLFS